MKTRVRLKYLMNDCRDLRSFFHYFVNNVSECYINMTYNLYLRLSAVVCGDAV